MRAWGIVIVAAGLLLAGCASVESGTAFPLPTASARNGQIPRTPASSVPTARDGMNVSACSGGSCEVSVEPGTAVPLPASTDVKNVKVTVVTRDRVTLTGNDAGNSSSGSCFGQCDSNDSNGAFTVTLGPDSEDIENSVSIVAEGFGDGRVVLRFDVAR